MRDKTYRRLRREALLEKNDTYFHWWEELMDDMHKEIDYRHFHLAGWVGREMAHLIRFVNHHSRNHLRWEMSVHLPSVSK